MVVQCFLSKIPTVTVLLGLCMTSQALETQYISSHAPLSSLTKKLHNYVQTNVMRWLVSCMNCLINSVRKLLLSLTTLGFWVTWTLFEENTSISKIRKRLFQRLVTTKHSNCLTFVTRSWSIQWPTICALMRTSQPLSLQVPIPVVKRSCLKLWD